jgi:predicted ATPase
MRTVRSSFVGRERDLARVESLLREGARLVTLLGPGGIGKSRLASELAARSDLDRRFVFAELASADAATMEGRVKAALARAFGAPESRRPLGETLADLEPVVLVLDDFDALGPAGVAILQAWIDEAPDALFVVTSRMRLKLETEHVHDVEPLRTPVDAGELETSPSGELLLAHLSRTAVPWPADDAGVRSSLADLLRCLDGIPLAIELAASRLRTVAPAELLARLQLGFRALGSQPARRAHHETLERCVALSWDLLDGDERSVLAQCAVFRGGFRIEAAEAVIEAGVLDRLHSLHDKSLLRVRADGRLEMLAPIRELALVRLTEMGLERDARERHARYYARAGAKASLAFWPSQSASALHAIRAEEQNLLAALEHADPVDACAVAVGLEPVVMTRGPTREEVERFSHALAAADRSGEVAAAALRLRARLKGRYFAGGSALADLEQALALGADPITESLVHAALAELHRFEGRLERAKEHIARAQALLDRDAPALRAYVDFEAASLALYLGDPLAAERAYTSAVDASRESGSRNLALALYGLGLCCVGRRNVARAEELLREALEAARAWGLREGELFVLAQIATLHHDLGDLDNAAQFYLAARSIARELDARLGRAQVEGRLGFVAVERGERERAHAWLTGALAQLGEESYVTTRALLHAGLVMLECAERRVERASDLARELRAAGDHREVAALRAIAEASLSRATGTPVPSLDWIVEGENPPLWTFATVRIAARLAQHLDPDPCFARLVSRPAAAALFSPELVIETSARRFIPPFGAPVDCTRRGPLWQVLLALVDAHERSPGEAISTAELLDRGWPGERMSARSAQNRLHVTLSTLRRLGLEHALVKEPGGYLLDAGLSVRVRS